MYHIMFRSIVLLVMLRQLCYSANASSIVCETTEHCENTLLSGSKCVGGFCSNPLHDGGCLKQMLPDWHKIRTCNSDDPPSAEKHGYCRKSPFDYMEVRIASQNWESAFFVTWIMQILLSEMLGIPVSVETGKPDLSVDLYNINSSLDYGVGNDWNALRRGAEVGDCRILKEMTGDEYQSCAHVFPEMWQESLVGASEYQKQGVIEPPIGLEALGSQNWYIPRFTAKNDTSLTSYLGLQGEGNRRKLAETFLRPTTWKDYCDQVSLDSCKTSNEVALRAPVDDDERSSMFVDGLYTGYFRATELNNCELNPTNCTGHIADYPCGWASFMKQQTHHLGIALESNGDEASDGYTYTQLTQIWAAAEATESNVMMLWWSPEILYQSYIGTEAEFTKVLLPPPTQECVDARVNPADRCGDDLDLKIGSPKGSCDTSPQALQKVIVTSLLESTNYSELAPEMRSPAYEAIKTFRINELQLGRIFEYWKNEYEDGWNDDPRGATCRWVVENFDFLESFIPGGFPRVVENRSLADEKILSYFAIALGLFLSSLVIGSACFVHQRRKKKAVYYAQEFFILTILMGLALLAAGAVLSAVPPSNESCIAIVWMTNFGYALAIIPLLLRINAIVRLVNSGKQMQHVFLSGKRFCLSLFASLILIVTGLVVWTSIDPEQKLVQYTLKNEKNDFGETVVNANSYCASESDVWMLASHSWKGIVLLCSIILGFLARSNREDVNDTSSLFWSVFSHGAFVAIRAILQSLGNDSINRSSLMRYNSLLLSLECIAAVATYILPKIRDGSDDQDTSEPLPDLFLNTTIMFADVVGFTAWSSVREPAQVFKFLESVYGEFDRLAEKRKVFKVETVGDCYVAATGIPCSMSDHAVTMAKFAADCLIRMHSLTDELEVLFGPDTCELSIRIGLHSGPVTGGFLKGKGARFQLFGDTMNTTGRIESSGEPGKIHVSEETADLLIKAGKQNWVEKRKHKVTMKGKGEMQTFWLDLMQTKHRRRSSSNISASISEKSSVADSLEDEDIDLLIMTKDDSFGSMSKRTERLVKWNVEILQGLLKQISSRRIATYQSRPSKMLSNSQHEPNTICATTPINSNEPKIPLEEVAEIVVLPEFDRRAARRQRQMEDIDLSDKVMDQLYMFVRTIADMYTDNPFHNFAHASHVVMSVIKHMNRITSPTDLDLGDEEEQQRNTKAQAALHDHTYGITSDPLTQFACVFSALIHDVDHPGVPNTQLIKEDPQLAAVYKNRSVAEQNSFELSWHFLMEDRFADLRSTIASCESELARFRQLVINSIMATDISDRSLKEDRNARWDLAFSIDGEEMSSASKQRDDINRKATIVIEHLIQAADVSHTMQHWHIYRDWNERLFRELYAAYAAGRSEKNPADFWADGEIGFFDFYIIPLSKKLRDCGVFGVSSDENLNYALKNREEWKLRGKDIVSEMMEKIRSEHLKEESGNQNIDKLATLEESTRDETSYSVGEEEEEERDPENCM